MLNAKGDVWVAAGNGSVRSPGRYDDSDSVLELSPSLKLLQFFAPSDWYNDNANDRDLGSSVPAVLPNGLVVQAGKSQTVYLLRASRLGGIGGQVDEKTNICGNDVDGGVAFSGSTAYLPCENGVMAVATDAKTLKLRVLWQTPTGAGGPADPCWRARVDHLEWEPVRPEPAHRSRSASGSRSAAPPPTSRPRRSETVTCWPSRTIRCTPSSSDDRNSLRQAMNEPFGGSCRRRLSCCSSLRGSSSAWRSVTFHSPFSRRYAWVQRSVLGIGGPSA